MATVTKVKGYVQNVGSRVVSAGTVYSVSVAGVQYGTWLKKPGCAEGDLVEFAAAQNGQYWNVKGDITVLEKAGRQSDRGPVAAPEIPSAASAVRGNVNPREDAKDLYWRQREERDVQTQKQITYQGSRNAALTFVDLLLKNSAITFEKGKNKSDAIEGLVLHYTQLFYDDTFALGREENSDTESSETEVPVTKWT